MGSGSKNSRVDYSGGLFPYQNTRKPGLNCRRFTPTKQMLNQTKGHWNTVGDPRPIPIPVLVVILSVARDYIHKQSAMDAQCNHVNINTYNKPTENRKIIIHKLQNTSLLLPLENCFPSSRWQCTKIMTTGLSKEFTSSIWGCSPSLSVKCRKFFFPGSKLASRRDLSLVWSSGAYKHKIRYLRLWETLIIIIK